ncbi:MAG: Hsp20/alpha crystallin family protein [Actinobacteria bacterium]|nr:Hsp20/alpha crystallin family protein [Actinomycetota bacterium]
MAPRDIDRLQGEIEELFADLWQVPRFAGVRRGFRPAVDCFVTTDPHELVVVVELAGIDPTTVEISVEERLLTIAGQRSRPRVAGQVYQQAEIEYGAFGRRLPLAHDVDPAAASASYQNGLLRITMPIAKRPPARRPIEITIRRNT